MSNSNNRLIYLSGEPRELINNASLKLKESKEHTSRQKLYSGLVRLFNKEVEGDFNENWLEKGLNKEVLGCSFNLFKSRIG